MRWMWIVVVFLGLPAWHAVAHGPGGHGAAGKRRDHVVAKQDGRMLSLRMVPQGVLEEASAEAAEKHQQQGEDVYRARVGELAFFVAELTEDGAPVAAVDYTLRIEQVEGDKQIFSTTVHAPDGVMNWGQQLFDGAAHRVSITAASTDSSFAPITANMVLGVEAVQPPSHVVARTLLLLVGLTAVAMIAGYGVMHSLAARRAAAPAPGDAARAPRDAARAPRDAAEVSG